MKVLVVANACRPDAGSEGYVGWTSVNAIAKEHEVWVLTHGFGREAINAALPTLPNNEKKHFVFLREWKHWNQNRLIARAQDWLEYSLWCKEARRAAIELHARIGFDVAHHVTFATWRIPSPLTGVGIPWLWGPVGGGEAFPFRFLQILSRNSAIFECARAIGNIQARTSRSLQASAQNASFVFANNPETCTIIRKLGVPSTRIRLVSQSFFPPERMASFCFTGAKPSLDSNTLQIFAGGNLEGRKGVSLVLRALAAVKDRGLGLRFLYGGQGPELDFLMKLREELDLSLVEVKLGATLTSEEYRTALKDSHIYLLPSLREGAPITMIEAMLSGCVPIVANCGGAAVLVNKECGILIPVTSPNKMVKDISSAILSLYKDPLRLRALSQAAVSRVRTMCSEECYMQSVTAAYNQIRGG